MKKLIIFLIMGLAAILLCSCNSRDAWINPGVNFYDFPEIPKNTNTDEKHSEKKKFVFTSSEEIENISDDDLMYILYNNYVTSDFFEEGSYNEVDLFGVEMQVPTKECPDAAAEYIMVNALNKEELEGFDDLASVVPSDCLKAYVQKDIEDFINAQNTRKPGEKTGTVVKDKEVIFCGETDSYVEYSARYTDSRSLYEDDVLVTHSIPRAYRLIYLKSLLRTTGTNSMQLWMLGELSKEYVEEILDIYLISKDRGMLYREVTEEDNCYTYTRYYAYMSYGDYGVDDEANLYKKVITIDKESHRVCFGNDELIKEIRIAGTAREWPMW